MKKILVIEDDELIRSTTIDLLEVEGFEVIGGANGREGLEKAQQHRPDLIISDIMMPALNGYEVLARLREIPATRAIPVIFLTARADKLSLRHGMEQGADDYLTKPFTRAEMLKAI